LTASSSPTTMARSYGMITTSPADSTLLLQVSCFFCRVFVVLQLLCLSVCVETLEFPKLPKYVCTNVHPNAG